MNAKTPLLTSGQWAIFLAYGAALAGLALISPRLAGVVGMGTIIVLVIKNSSSLGIGVKQ